MSGGHACPGTVLHLVGAGSGASLLLTRRAAPLLAEADVVVFDRRSLETVATLALVAVERCFVCTERYGIAA